MLKWPSPVIDRFGHHYVGKPTAVSNGKGTKGQYVAERTAAVIGSWAFLITQAGFLFLWLVYNTVSPQAFDKPPYILLNLLLSFQAAFTGPVLLIAANVGAIRDHRQYDRIEQMEERILAAITGGSPDSQTPRPPDPAPSQTSGTAPLNPGDSAA